MSEVSGSMSITRDQSQYILGSGMLNRSLSRHILKCSVTFMPLEGLLDDEEAEVLSNSNNYKPNNAFN